MSQREQALGSLLGIDPGTGPEDYPPDLVLPDYIHNRAVEAVERTVEDTRERSIHFRYRRDKWLGGISVPGTRLRLDDQLAGKAHVNRLHHLWGDNYPPHIHFHSHPSADPAIVEDQAAQALEAAGEDLNAEQLATTKAAFGELTGAVMAMPGRGDIVSSLCHPLPSVASLLAGKGGSFLWVHRDLRVTKSTLFMNPLFPYTKQYQQKRQAARAEAEPVAADAQAGLEVEFDVDPESSDVTSDIEDTIQAKLLIRARALSRLYICYASRDLEDPRLTRIQVDGRSE